MKYIDEFRDGEVAQKLAVAIRREAAPNAAITSWNSAAAIRMPFPATASPTCCRPT
jgi:hypothetical protein